jgi:chromosome segregation protein
MKLAGFKSFFQKTELTFTDGITAVVGPNGCGKSNISDAISWVLGEQSSKSLRGSKMEDVIFNGSAKRGPLPMAEVTLTLAWSAADGNGNGAGGVAVPEPETTAAGPAPSTREPAAALDSPAGDPVIGEAPDSGNGNGHFTHSAFTIPTVEGAEITVTRRLFRNGDSEYRIDDKRVRLRDVQDLMQSARIGSRTYAVIEQDRISALLSARPKERKEMIEEAAGILGIKARKRAALLKLEHTEANLARLRDLIAEIARQVNSLKRQAAKARRFQRNAEEIRRCRRILFCREFEALSRLVAGLEEDLERLRGEEAGAAAALSRLDARVEALRQRIDEEGRGAADRREALHEVEREVDRLEAQMNGLVEKSREASALSVRRAEEAAELRNRAAAAQHERARQEESRQRLLAEVRRLEDELAVVEADYTAKLAAADESARAAERDRNRLLAAVARLGEAKNRAMQLQERGKRLAHQRQRLEREGAECRQELEELRRRLRGSAAGVEEDTRLVGLAESICAEAAATREQAVGDAEKSREALAAARRELHSWEERETALASLWHASRDEGGFSDSGQPLAESIEVEPEWEAAAGTWAAGMLQARIVSTVGEALEAVDAVRRRGGGRIRFVVPELVSRAPDRDERALSSVLNGDAGRSGLLAGALGDPVLVPDLDEAVAHWRRRPGRACLTPSGDGITPHGIIVGGSRGETAGLLVCNRQRREAAEAAAALRRSLPGLEAAATSFRQALEAAETRHEEARCRREGVAHDAVERRTLHQRLQEEKSRLERRLQVVRDEDALLAAEEEEHGRESALAGSEHQEADDERQAAEAAAAGSQRSLDVLREEIHVLASDRAERKSVCAARRETLSAMEQEVRRLEAEGTEHAERAARYDGESRELAQTSAERRAESELLRGERDRAVDRAAALREMCRADEMTLQESRAALAEAEGAARERRQVLEAARERTREKELERTRAGADLEHLSRECREEFGGEPASLATDLTQEEREAEPVQVREQLARLEEIRDRIGPVNMMAVEQYAEVEERQRFLQEQQHDLEESIRSLNKTIERIDRTAKERLVEALEAIRTEFGHVFRRLFDGGVADIELQEPENVLESGVEIIAQPPGKRTRNINLLSGGEKSLSAIALLFAIFKYRPSPFCLLDEVDAALDEANIERFTRLLREYGRETQFILITHNRRSMEVADVMYGVTMEEPGISQTVSLNLT